MKKRLFSLFLSLAMALSLMAPLVSAAGETPAVSDNINGQDYTSWSRPVTSYLMENEAGGLTRVEYIKGQIVVENYSSDFAFQSGRTIPMELSTWGGFFAGADYNFFVFGQQNSDESDSTEVIRVVKYSTDWNRLGAVSLYGANTAMPFAAGSLRADEYGGQLYIRTCHQMYAGSDGLHHQANLTLCVDQESMRILDSYYVVMNPSVGYVSHSFNQFVLVDSDRNLITLDHGDAYPRGAVLMQYNTKAGEGKFSGLVSATTVQRFSGSIGDNTTGASLGGLAEASSGYVAAYNYDGAAGSGPRTVYLSYIPKNGGAASSRALSSAGTTTPQLVSTGLDGGYLLWNDKDGRTAGNTLSYVRYDGTGGTGTVRTASGSLSDCAPISYNGKVVWYTTDGSTPVFYTLDGSGVTAHPVGGSTQQPETPEQTVKPQETPGPTPTPSVGVERMYAPPTVGPMEAIDADGNLWVWGTDAVYMGYHDMIDEFDRPVQSVPVKTDISGCLATGEGWYVKEDHSLWMWGLRGNISGSYADDHVIISQPVKVMDDVLYCDGVADDRDVLIALKTDGTLWGWGTRGTLTGKDTAGSEPVPVTAPIKLLDNVKEARSSQRGWMALKTDGSLWACGNSNSANLDAQAYTGDQIPLTRVMDGVVAFDLSWQNALAIKEDGSLWVWGNNNYGQVGNGGGYDYHNGSQYVQTTPVKVLDNVVHAKAGYNTYAVTAGGTLWGWGSNSAGQLGFTGGNFTDRDSYSQRPCQSTPVAITTDVYVSEDYVLKTDGSLWACVGDEDSFPGAERQGSMVKVMDNVALPVYIEPNYPEGPTEPTEPELPVSFVDVPFSHWAHAYIQRAADQRWINGVGGGRFAPEGTLSGYEFFTLLGRAFYPEDIRALATSYPNKLWWYTPCTVVYQHGVLEGTASGACRDAQGDWPYQDPAPVISRGEMALAMANLMEDKGVTVTDAQKTAAQAKIGDWNQIPAAYRDAVSTVYALGIITGTSQGTFAPNQGMTRAEAATVLCRLADALAEG